MEEVAPFSVEEISGLLRDKFGEVLNDLERYKKRNDELWNNKKYKDIVDDVIPNDGEFSEQAEEVWMDEQHIGGESIPIKKYYKNPSAKNLETIIDDIAGGYDEEYCQKGIDYLRKTLKKEEFDRIKGLNLQERILKTPKQVWIDALEKEKIYLEPLKNAPYSDYERWDENEPYGFTLQYKTTFKVRDEENTAKIIKQKILDGVDEDIEYFVKYLINTGILTFHGNMYGSILPTPSSIGWLLDYKDKITENNLDDLVTSREGLTYRIKKQGGCYFMSFFIIKEKNNRDSEKIFENWRALLEAWGEGELTPALVIDNKSNFEEKVKKYCDDIIKQQ